MLSDFLQMSLMKLMAILRLDLLGPVSPSKITFTGKTRVETQRTTLLSLLRVKESSIFCFTNIILLYFDCNSTLKCLLIANHLVICSLESGL